jgi:hypothetical protein
MIIGRNAELKQLSTYYDRDKSQIIVLYGQKYIGKTALIKEFMMDKPGFYYCAFPASEREQKYRFGIWLASLGVRTLKYPEFSEVFQSLGKEHSQKKVIVIDEFQHIIKTCPTFMDELISFIHNSWNDQEYLVILLSSSVGFIENSMVSRIKEAAFELSGFIKMKELSFENLKETSFANCPSAEPLLPGGPGLALLTDTVRQAGVHQRLIGEFELHRQRLEIANNFGVQPHRHDLLLRLDIRVLLAFAEVVFVSHGCFLLMYVPISFAVAFRAEMMRICVSFSR